MLTPLQLIRMFMCRESASPATSTARRQGDVFVRRPENMRHAQISVRRAGMTT